MDHDPPMGWDDDHADDGFAADEGHEPDALDTGHDDPGTGDDGQQSADLTDHGTGDDPAYETHHDAEPGLSYSDEYDQDTGTDHTDASGYDEPDTGGHDEPEPLPEPVSGAHPDLETVGDDPHWADDPFPPQLDIGEPPEPVDGFPWSDPAVLGEEHDTGAAATAGSPPADDLLAYDAHEAPDGTDAWQVLAGSDDPATSSLARFWAPGT